MHLGIAECNVFWRQRNIKVLMLTQGKTKPNQTTPTAHTNPSVACGGLPSNP